MHLVLYDAFSLVVLGIRLGKKTRNALAVALTFPIVLQLVLPSLQSRLVLFAVPVLANLFVILTQFVMLSQDYAETRRESRELAAENDFYHRMAHDLLTPLTVVSTVQVAKLRPREADELFTHSQCVIIVRKDFES